MSTWYAVNTQPHQETRAEENLRRQGYGVFLPGYWKTRRHARKVDRVRAPLFPGYIFVSLLSGRAALRPINSTFGVRRLVTFGDEPAVVPQAFMDNLVARCGEDRIFIDPRLQPGAEIRLVDGPFVDVIGRLLHLGDGERVTVLMSLLGREVRKTVRLQDIAPAG
jgi:transcriptional antiterminator RfaH